MRVTMLRQDCWTCDVVLEAIARFSARRLRSLIFVHTRCERSAAAKRKQRFDLKEIQKMETLLVATPVVAAAGYSLVYLLAGGGVFGAVVIFVIAKMLGR
ncbi:MAG: hypothetical protein AB7U73_13970 [Pirellulales bacterium]